MAASRVSALGLVLALVGLAGLAQTPASAPFAAPPPIHAATPVGPVDVNVASAEELATLPRIGPTLASRIVLDRATHGPFVTLDELDCVPGLGPGIVAALRAHATVGPTTP